jgi:hypothetical protein
VDRRLRAEAANIPLNGIKLEDAWGYKEKEEARKDNRPEFGQEKVLIRTVLTG